MTAHIRLLGDRALQVQWADESAADSLAQFALHLRQQAGAPGLPGLEEIVPSERSVLLVFNAAHPPTADQRRAVRAVLAQFDEAARGTPTVHELPVCYAEPFAPDLPAIADAAGLSRCDVIDLHCSTTYTVRAVGFAPGFAYMGTVDARIATPRLQTPRKQVPAGAVGIADARTAIYPAASPGGWNIIGRCPMPLFDVHQEPPGRLQVGDQVRFQSVSVADYEARGGAL